MNVIIKAGFKDLCSCIFNLYNIVLHDIWLSAEKSVPLSGT